MSLVTFVALSFKENIAYRKLKRYTQVKKSARLKTMQEVKTVALVYNVEEVSWKDVTKIIKYFESFGKSVTTLGYLDEKELNHNYTPNYKHMFFCNEQMSFWKLPMPNSIQSFITTPFDYLINLDVKGDMRLQAVSAYSSAQTRIGLHFSKYEFCQDLMIGVDVGTGTELFEHIKENILK